MTKWKMVPVEATDEMRDAAYEARNIHGYIDAIAAAPEYEPTAEQVERAARAVWPRIPLGGTGDRHWWPKAGGEHTYDWSGNPTAANDKEKELCRLIARAVLMTLEG